MLASLKPIIRSGPRLFTAGSVRYNSTSYDVDHSNDGSPMYPVSSIPVPNNYDPMKYRKWINLNPNSINDDRKISVMSFNLLSRHYIWKQVFSYLQPDYLDWANYRFPLINKIIDYFKCDIMCFQELECEIYQKYWNEHAASKDYCFLPNYKSFYMKKSSPNYWGNKPANQIDGVGIFLNTDRFEVIDELRINFADYIRKNPSKFDMTNDLIKRVLPRNTVALVLKAFDKKNSKTVYISNTHLYWSPKFNDVKAIQTKLLLNLLKDFINKSDPHTNNDFSKTNIIMCGDFNSTPNSLVFNLLSRGEIDLLAAKEFSHLYYGSRLNNEILIDSKFVNPFDLSPAYDALLKDTYHVGHKLKFTSYTQSLTAVLDHIWFSSHNFTVTRVLSEVDTKYTLNSRVNGFPDAQFPSDHIPLISEIAYM